MPFCLKIVEHLASQVGKRQTRIMRVPEMMCPKKGTNMIGFLPESEENSYKDNPIPYLQIQTCQREGRGRGRQKWTERLLCILSTFGKCSPGRNQNYPLNPITGTFINHLRMDTQCSGAISIGWTSRGWVGY